MTNVFIEIQYPESAFYVVFFLRPKIAINASIAATGTATEGNSGILAICIYNIYCKCKGLR
jgi:hypothetical protein